MHVCMMSCHSCIKECIFSMHDDMLRWHNCMLRELELVGINYLGIRDDTSRVAAGIGYNIFQ